MRRYPKLLVAWGLTVLLSACMWFGLPELALPLLVTAITLAVLTVKRTERTGELRRAWLYRGALAIQLVACATCVVGASSTVLFDVDESPVVGFAVHATTNVVLVVLAWRALVYPGPRRAAVVGSLAIPLEIVALIVDAGLNMFRAQPDTTLFVVGLYASVLATWAGALVCIAALVAFEAPPPPTNVPAARVVDES